jgi:hypothetical protein
MSVVHQTEHYYVRYVEPKDEKTCPRWEVKDWQWGSIKWTFQVPNYACPSFDAEQLCDLLEEAYMAGRRSTRDSIR